jgi:hypothetical protein
MPIAIISWMMHAHLRSLIVKWFRRSQGETVEFDVFDRFASLWISFNAWGTYESHSDTDRKMIEWAKTNSTLATKFSELISNDAPFRQDVTRLQAMCPIRRNRPYRGSRDVTITAITNFSEVLEAVYTIRCNFFHGEKSPDDTRDRTLTELAFQILSKVFAPKIAELST